MPVLSDRTILITGGARGIGLSLAELCVADGATVLLVDVSREHLDQACEALSRRGARVVGYVHDITDRQACHALAQRIHAEVGPVDVLVNNAGVVHKGDFLSGSPDVEAHWDRTVQVNLGGLMWMMRAFVPAMVDRGAGQVVNVASILGLAPVGGAAVYCATKHAVVALTEAVRFELLERGQRGVTLTTVCPGFTDTGMFRGVRTPPLFRAVSPASTARAIHRTIGRRARLLKFPYRYHLLPQIYALTPHWLWSAITRAFGVHRAMDSHQDRAG